MTRDTLLALAQKYNANAGLPAYVATQPATLPPTLARRIADAFDALPYRDEAAAPAYEALAAEVDAQFQVLVAAGLTFLPDDGGNDYGSAATMSAALLATDTLLVFTGGEPHAYLSDYQNWQLRCVHDVFGHVLSGGSFGPNGEDRAWRSHRQMFSPLALAALTTETRGQNCWFWNSQRNDGLPGPQRSYADQKAALLPAWCYEIGYGED